MSESALSESMIQETETTQETTETPIVQEEIPQLRNTRNNIGQSASSESVVQEAETTQETTETPLVQDETSPAS